MTLEQDYDLRALSYFKDHPKQTMSDIINYLAVLMGNEAAGKLYEQYVHKNYFTIERVNESNEYTISEGGIIYIEFLKKELDKESIDIKVKQIAIANSIFQKWVPICSAIIAALSLIATIFIARSKAERPYIPVQEMRQLEKTQEQINKSIEQYLDTLRVHQ
jgi:hypothetical protein